MSKKAKQYSATEKTKIVIEAIKAEMTIAQISSKYGVHATQIQAWKKRGIENLVSGFQVKPAIKDPDIISKSASSPPVSYNSWNL
jgi:transposase